MTAYNVVNPASMVSGQAEDVSQILANFNAIAAVLNGGIDNANINAAAAIAYSKLNLALGIKNADIDPAAAIAIAKLAGYPTDGAKVLKGDGTWGSAGGFLTAPVHNTGLIDVVNSVAETNLINHTIPAALMGANNVMKVDLWGDWFNNSGASVNLTYRLYWGGSAIIDTGVFNLVVGANRIPYHIEIFVVNKGSVSSQRVIAKLPINTGNGIVIGTGQGENRWIVGTNNALAVDTSTGAAVLRLTGQLGTASPNAELRIDHSMVTYL